MAESASRNPRTAREDANSQRRGALGLSLYIPPGYWSRRFRGTDTLTKNAESHHETSVSTVWPHRRVKDQGFEVNPAMETFRLRGTNHHTNQMRLHVGVRLGMIGKPSFCF